MVLSKIGIVLCHTIIGREHGEELIQEFFHLALYLQICVHRLLAHDSVIKFYGHRKNGTRQYLFLEYACGGELFDRIGEITSRI